MFLIMPGAFALGGAMPFGNTVVIESIGLHTS